VAPGGARLVTASFASGLDVPAAAPMPTLKAPAQLAPQTPAAADADAPQAEPQGGEG
jgi:hypothetical protein